MSILEYNGAAIVAMVGKDCVGIASDSRLGIQAMTVACDFQKVFQMGPKYFVGLAGLGTDVQTLNQTLKFKMNMYKLREEREMKVRTFANLLSTTLYEKRFGPYFCEPVVAGLEDDGKPFICAMDLLGCPVSTSDFVVSGTCSQNLYGVCESLFEPDMEPEDLFEVLSQSLLASVDRDALSGWGAVVHIITKDGVMTKHLKTRQD